jgi:hypothetical protein
LSAIACCAGPARQRATATWPPCAASAQRLKAAVGTARLHVPTALSRLRRATSDSAAHPLRPIAASHAPPPRPAMSARPCPKAPRPAIRAEPSPLSPPSPSRASTSEHRPSASRRRSSPVELELTLLSLLTIAGPPPATVAPPHRRDAAVEPDFFSSPSKRSSGELACRPPCPTGSLTIVGARPPPFTPSPPL